MSNFSRDHDGATIGFESTPISLILNVTVASQFPWSIFAVAGIGIDLFMHWYFGVVHRDEFMCRHQQDIEHRTAV